MQRQNVTHPLVGRAATRRRTWSKRTPTIKNSSCAGDETSPCNASRPWPESCSRRLQNRPLTRDDARLAKEKREKAQMATESLLPCQEETTKTGVAASKECDRADLCAAMAAPSSAELSVSPKEQKQKRSVTFDMNAVTIHHIPPYAEIYGLHPREFVFDKRYYMIPSVCALTSIGLSAVDKVGADDDDVEDSDSDSENDVWEPWEVQVQEVHEDAYRLAEALD